MEAWISAFEKLKQSLILEFKAAPEIQRDLLLRSQLQANINHRHHSRSQSTSNFLGQSMMVAGNTAIVRSRAASAAPPPKPRTKPTFGATFVIGGEMDILRTPKSTAATSIKRESVATESMLAPSDGAASLLDGRADSSISANYLPLDVEP